MDKVTTLLKDPFVRQVVMIVLAFVGVVLVEKAGFSSLAPVVAGLVMWLTKHPLDAASERRSQTPPRAP